ncbi:MAG TPA: 8-amino-7-oxononanoate synthase [Conexibacter sp.]
MIEIEARLDELEHLGLGRRTRLVSGPQGPRVVLDGKPVLLLCSNNYLGLADHPAVREAAADAAMRWGVGAGASRCVSGTMTIHRRLEERIAAFSRRQAALLFGSGYLANVGVVSALARAGDVVFSDERNQAAIIDGCRLSRADVFIYEHGDVEHLEWGLREAEGRGALIVTDGVFGLDGGVAPLPELVELANRYDVRLVVDESHGVGTLGPGGRGAVAEAGCEDGVDLIVGTLGTALGSYGAYVACDQQMARYLVSVSRALIHSTAPSPPGVAGALAALSLLEEQPRRVEKLQANVELLRDELAASGFEIDPGPRTPIVSLVLGDAKLATRVCEKALDRGVFAQPLLPPQVPDGTARLRLAVMASHSKSELRDATRALAQAVKAAGARPEQLRPQLHEQVGLDDDFLPAAAPIAARVASASAAAAAAPGVSGPSQPAPTRNAALWDDGDGELWVERRAPQPAAGRPFDGELDRPPSRRRRERSAVDAEADAQGIFDAEAAGALVEHAA